jgi:hypothetical protein
MTTTNKLPIKKTRTPMNVEAKRARAAKKADAVTEMHRYGIGKQSLNKITGSQTRPSNPLTIDDQQHPTMRPGSMAALGIPTRIGDYLVYRDGTRQLDPIPMQVPINPYAAFVRG